MRALVAQLAPSNPHSQQIIARGRRVRRPALPVLVHVLPSSSSSRSDSLGLSSTSSIVIAVYVMLALGLNIVVGYAGLLDLGYVAFYALGAYTVGWFASTCSPASTSASSRDQRAIHIGGIHSRSG